MVSPYAKGVTTFYSENKETVASPSPYAKSVFGLMFYSLNYRNKRILIIMMTDAVCSSIIDISKIFNWFRSISIFSSSGCRNRFPRYKMNASIKCQGMWYVNVWLMDAFKSSSECTSITFGPRWGYSVDGNQRGWTDTNYYVLVIIINDA